MLPNVVESRFPLAAVEIYLDLCPQPIKMLNVKTVSRPRSQRRPQFGQGAIWIIVCQGGQNEESPVSKYAEITSSLRIGQRHWAARRQSREVT